mmetsp:Transcript_25721/g.66528  ORF Transcript_25721/g.66528 Transcript_25721/m.66528 type:complete len:121 (+) Transcript_25721:54-416(+)|eukprot:CAMPEP_0119413950 /NCGR_PEP_ID=MMETSP1335-20130426/6273_1 /TAXON_ID=259385 /ORGANISM="Chrysoculter rhomboideus, Strain RCC1486" /LENGTH=120 /DNA_ID=CAMNT_0007438785 /DNA_START=42 /DNA_END=404 /DNA_ORIENTATION=+
MRLLLSLLLAGLAACVSASSADVAFVAPRAVGLVQRTPACSAVAGVEMRGAVKSTKLKGAKIRSAVAKRMKVTAGGKILRRRANKQHLLSNKPHKNKKHAAKIGQVSDAMVKNYLQILQP